MGLIKRGILLLILWITACVSPPQVQQLPPQTVTGHLFKVKQQKPYQSISLLSVQYAPNQWRWVQTDPLGVPLARLILNVKGWQNDGFAPPNPQAKQLFSAIATYLNPTEPLFSFSRIEQGNYEINGKWVWQLLNTQNSVTILLADGSQWSIEQLD